MKLKEVQEGESRLSVPDVQLPESGDVFYHPQQSLSRDISILVYKTMGYDVLDSMAGSGARAVRLANNGVEVVANDYSDKAVELIRRNAELNGVDLEILQRDAHKLFHERRFGAVDLDPFGSPAPFVHCALHSAVKLLAVASTDTSALAGTYPRVSRRRYGFDSLKFPNYPEFGIRALAGFVIREAAKLEIAAKPVFSHAYRHYYRLYFFLKKGARRTDKLLGELGEYRGKGPIYMGDIWDKELVEKMMSAEAVFGHKLTMKHLDMISREADYPKPYYDLHGLSRELGISPPKMDEVLETVDGVRTHFSPTGFRSHLEREDVKKAISSLKS